MILSKNQKAVQEKMKELQNPPEEQKEAYNAVKEYYDAYSEFVNLVLNPTGNLSTFTSSYNDADSKVYNCYKKMQIYFE